MIIVGQFSVNSDNCFHSFGFLLQFHQNPAKAIRIITLDPSGSWLVCACVDGSLYVVPVAGLVQVRLLLYDSVIRLDN